jgi:hypothetical protein
MRKRIVVATLLGLTTGFLCTFWLSRVQIGAGDFNWAIWAAQDLLAHRNPYARPMQLYPLTASIFGFPFVRIRPEFAGGIFYGISSALMAFALTRDNYRRLFIFLAYPYWASLFTAQWTPLLVAAAFLPPLLPVTFVKPQIGLPIFFTRFTRRGLIACVIIIALSFLLLPGWLHLWVANFLQYARFIPLLVLPGPLLALALFRYRSRDAWLLLLMALVPQRWFYDMLILWIIPKSWRELSMTVLVSWAAGIWRWYHVPHSFNEVGRIAVIFLYLPMLAIVLFRSESTPDPATVSP